jgi:hypothetical protein
MIVIGIDGINWEIAEKWLKDLFPIQTMKMIKCNVREFSDTPEKGQPTVLGLACSWAGEKIKKFDSNIYNRLNPVNKTQEEDNYAIRYIDADGKDLDLIFNHFKRNKIFVSGHGPNPHCDMKEHFIYFSKVPNAFEMPSEEMAFFYEVWKDDWDLFWFHTSICKTAGPWPGPYEQGKVPSLIPYDIIRKDKELKKKVFEFGVMRMKYIIKCVHEMRPNDIIVVTTDHGSNLDTTYKQESIDDIFILVNKDINMDDINFQWDVKKLLLRLKSQYIDTGENK